MTYGMTTLEVRAEADAELARQYALARELRGPEPDEVFEPWERGYWTGPRVSKLRELRGESKVEFARHIGVTATTIGSWEHDPARPKQCYVPKLMELDRQVRERG